MSLTSHIDTRTSPVRAFFELELGDAKALVGEFNAALRGARERSLGRLDSDSSLVGTAIDVLLNTWLDPLAPSARPATAPTLDSAVRLAESQFASRTRSPTGIRRTLRSGRCSRVMP
jgi:hypothetical protein